MKFEIRTGSPETQKTDCLVVGIYENGSLTAEATAVDKAAAGLIRALVKRGDFTGKQGTALLLQQAAGLGAARLVLVGLGDREKFSDAAFRAAVTAGIKAAVETGAANVLLHILSIPELKRDIAWCAQQAGCIAGEVLYRFDEFKSTKAPAVKLASIGFGVVNKELAVQAKEGMLIGEAMAAGASLTRDLGNMPPNICSPSYLAEQAKKLGAKHKLAVEVLDRKQMQALRMDTLLSVSAGSHQPPKFIVIKHMKGGAKTKPVVLVGKGVTFDTGGISLKPGPEMDEMKYDMCGAASVLGTMKSAAMLNLPINLIGVIPATENMPGGGATRPGDIITSMSGQTVEILNTDAEGRLILCDALTYVERFEPECVVDIATLTGACIIALGHVASGMLANDDKLASELQRAGTTSGDRVWQLPLWDDYQDQLKSNFADMANIGGRAAGTITAASFLARFTKKYRWAHLDIAGTAWRSGKDKGATGRPVPLLVNFLVNRAAKPANKSAKAGK